MGRGADDGSDDEDGRDPELADALERALARAAGPPTADRLDRSCWVLGHVVRELVLCPCFCVPACLLRVKCFNTLSTLNESSALQDGQRQRRKEPWEPSLRSLLRRQAAGQAPACGASQPTSSSLSN